MSEISYELPEDIAKEFRVEDDGKVFAKSARAVARLCGCSDSSIRLLLEKVASAEPSGGMAQTQSNGLSEPLKPFASQDFRVSGEYSEFSYDFVIALLEHFTFHAQITNKIAFYNYFKLQNIVPPHISPRTRTKATEKHYANKLAIQLSGVREVVTIVGNIDILTATEIIEVKNIRAWKGAAGQILMYSLYYPSHQKRIHLFGETQEKYLDLVRQHCNKFSICVTWER